MHVRQASLLILDTPHTRYSMAENAIPNQLLAKHLRLHVEYSRYQIRAVRCSLTGIQLSLYFLPLWIGCKGNKKRWSTIMAYNCHCILENGLHETVTANIVGW